MAANHFDMAYFFGLIEDAVWNAFLLISDNQAYLFSEPPLPQRN
jgi:hypothetical protein